MTKLMYHHCGHVQDFHVDLIKRGRAHGLCDKCRKSDGMWWSRPQKQNPNHKRYLDHWK